MISIYEALKSLDRIRIALPEGSQVIGIVLDEYIRLVNLAQEELERSSAKSREALDRILLCKKN